ncbi:MAG TPA: hypothetical protein VEX69_02385 [Candidatus Limnocylindria bacterium]|nr:hypothetical protein [Candidatus Limnocylindria bacterium]
MAKHKRGKNRKVKGNCHSRHPFPGQLVVVGGQSRKVGKTALMVDLIKAFPKYRWTAIKITPHADSGCPVKGAKCTCGPGAHTFAIHWEKIRKGKTDTSRFLAAGAEKSVWLQTKSGKLTDALPSLISEIGDVENVIVESNSILRLWKPDLFLLVLDPANPDFKNSARKVWRLADAFVFRSPPEICANPNEEQIPKSGRPNFLQPLGAALPGKVQKFVRQHFRLIDHHKARQQERIFS